MKQINTSLAFQKAGLILTIARMMKLTLVFFLFACFQVSAKGWSQQRITLKMSGAELKKVLFTIEKKTDYRFLFTEDAVKRTPKVNIDVKEATLTEVLDQILKNTSIRYKVMAANLVILKDNKESISNTTMKSG
jgi:hypothetical protein